MDNGARIRICNAAFVAAAFVTLVFVFFPGRMDGDSYDQYKQGLAFGFDDSHSVLVAALMGFLSDIQTGPGPMFVLQLVAFCGGLFLVTDTLIEAGHPNVGQLVSLAALTPILAVDYFEVQKDALFSGLLLVLIGLALRRYVGRGRLSVLGGFLAFCLLVLTLDTRQNSVFALVPLSLIAWPMPTPRLRPILVTLAIGFIVLASAASVRSWITGPVLKAHRSHLLYALIIYDLAGITARTGQDASAGMLPDFPANVARCYSPHQWDAFQGGIGRGNCLPVGEEAWQIVADPAARATFTRVWISQIVSHPLAYAAHRAGVFGCLIRVGCYDTQDMSPGTVFRSWDGPNIRLTVSAQAMLRVAHLLWAGPLGYGVLWILLLVAEVAGGVWSLRKRYDPTAFLGVVLAASALAYLSSFAIIGVADELRYLHPVMLLALVSLPITIAAVARTARSHARPQAADAPVAATLAVWNVRPFK